VATRKTLGRGLDLGHRDFRQAGMADQGRFQPRNGRRSLAVDCRAEYLTPGSCKAAAELGVEQHRRWQLHRIDPSVPRGEQFGAVKQLLMGA